MITINIQRTRHIRVLREKAKLSFEEAKERLEISESMMKKLELGFKRPSIVLGMKMLGVFNCTLDDIFLPYMSQIVSNSKNN